MILKLTGFRPLSGSYISQWIWKVTYNFQLYRFRPLSGSYISQYRERNTNAMVKRVSVPYRGATFLNNHINWNYGNRYTLFPSPIGELHFSIKSRMPDNRNELFPSPIGELHFSIFSLSSTKLFPQRFPSPIGELHFSINASKYEKCENYYSFRPLSGSYISQYW